MLLSKRMISGSARERRPGLLGEPRIDQRPGRQAGDPAVDQLAAADVDHRQVGIHRFRLAPVEHGAGSSPDDSGQAPVGDSLQPLRDADLEAEVGLVGEGVVAGDPGRRAARLADPQRPVAGPVPTLGRPVRVDHRFRPALVVDDDRERLARRQGFVRSDLQLVLAAGDPGAFAVDPDRGHLRARRGRGRSGAGAGRRSPRSSPSPAACRWPAGRRAGRCSRRRHSPGCRCAGRRVRPGRSAPPLRPLRPGRGHKEEAGQAAGEPRLETRLESYVPVPPASNHHRVRLGCAG